MRTKKSSVSTKRKKLRAKELCKKKVMTKELWEHRTKEGPTKELCEQTTKDGNGKELCEHGTIEEKGKKHANKRRQWQKDVYEHKEKKPMAKRQHAQTKKSMVNEVCGYK